ncbi:MAG: class I SAM-dependent methyltransferase [Planctomycetaceae bacterium]|nr:class I SAM-dependent methyltransferase [Planctomycetaceae bacterium]
MVQGLVEACVSLVVNAEPFAVTQPERRSSALRTMPGTVKRDRLLELDEITITRAAREHGPGYAIVPTCVRTMVREFLLRTGRRLNIRKLQSADIRAVYRALGLDDFHAINARQAWANWRTIPRNLNGRLPREPVTAIDLCCGVGDSTAVLAYYCSSGSRILGIDAEDQFIAAARRRTFVDGQGHETPVQFQVQDVLDAWTDEHGRRIPGQSVDLVNAVGAFGCHFDRTATARVVEQCRRVVRPGGLAMFDAGRDGTSHAVLAQLFTQAGFEWLGRARSCCLDRFWQLCFRKRGP